MAVEGRATCRGREAGGGGRTQLASFCFFWCVCVWGWGCLASCRFVDMCWRTYLLSQLCVNPGCGLPPVICWRTQRPTCFLIHMFPGVHKSTAEHCDAHTMGRGQRNPCSHGPTTVTTHDPCAVHLPSWPAAPNLRSTPAPTRAGLLRIPTEPSTRCTPVVFVRDPDPA